MTSVPLSFDVNRRPPSSTVPSPATSTLPGTVPPTNGLATASDTATFWRGVSLTYRYCNKVIAAGGMCYSYIYSLGNDSFSFTHSHSIPNITASAATALMKPLFTSLQEDLNIPVTLPSLTDRSASLYAGNGRRTGSANPVNTRYRSRLFPSHLWDDDTAWDATFAAIRAGVEEGGYTFHGIAYSPTEAIAGWPGADSAVNPAWRATALHGSLMDVQPEGISAAEARARDARVHAYVQRWKDLTPGAGAYMNEGDPAEIGWKRSFYGKHYAKLLEIKRKWDPWAVFWAQTTVGSEAWEVVSLDDYPAGQNGRLCRPRGRRAEGRGEEGLRW
jgi:hypothetical protein